MSDIIVLLGQSRHKSYCTLWYFGSIILYCVFKLEGLKPGFCPRETRPFC